MKKRIIGYSIILLICSIVLTYTCIEFFRSEETEGYVRQYQEESIAEMFLQDVRNSGKEQEDSERCVSVPIVELTEKEYKQNTEAITAPADQVDLNYSDDNYEMIGGVRYTPDYAAGRPDCVLEIPKIHLRRGVYTGTASEIQHDLDIWMTTTAHTDYILGKTHYCIYGHNSPTQNLTFNNLKNVGIGDIFLLTTEDSVYLYDVTDFFAQWRELVKWEITDNFSLPADKCYIITCGRDQYRYKDIVIEGTLREKYSIEEWLHGGESDISETTLDSIPTVITGERLTVALRVELSSDTVMATLTTPDGTPIPDADLCFTDADGLFLDGFSRVTTNEKGFVNAPVSCFNPGEKYAVGVIDMHTEKYAAPMDQEFVIHVNSKVVMIESKEVNRERRHPDSYMIIWVALILLLFGVTVITAVRQINTIRGGEKDYGNRT